MKNIQIYTDGACSGNPGPGGYGAVLICDGKELEISGGDPETTNNRMEILAVIEALKQVKFKCGIDIYSDSSYVVNAFAKSWIDSWIKNNWRKSDGEEVKNPDLWLELHKLILEHSVTWHKVKGHSDNEYNNRCDKLATDYIKNNFKSIERSRDEVYSGALAEKIMDTETIFKGRVFTVEKVTVELPNDKRANREIVRHTGGAAIVALDEDNNIYVVRQFRTALNKVILEIPAGKLEQGEDPYECAKRELLEETGLAAKNMELLLKMNTSPGYCSELLYIYIATGLTQSNPHYDVDEFLTCEKMPVDSLTDMVYSGEITDGKSIAGILAARKFIQRI